MNQGGLKMNKNELWLLVSKSIKRYVRGSGKNLVIDLMNKRRYLDKEDIISELTIHLVEELTDKHDIKLTQAFFNKALKRDLLDWIKHNNRQRYDEGCPTQYIEESVDEEEILTLDILPGMQSEEPSPEDYMIAKQLSEFAMDYFNENELDVLLGKASREDMARELDIPYNSYQKQLNKKITQFKIDAKEARYI